jgi:hypothetical protein
VCNCLTLINPLYGAYTTQLAHAGVRPLPGEQFPPQLKIHGVATREQNTYYILTQILSFKGKELEL